MGQRSEDDAHAELDDLDAIVDDLVGDGPKQVAGKQGPRPIRGHCDLQARERCSDIGAYANDLDRQPALDAVVAQELVVEAFAMSWAKTARIAAETIEWCAFETWASALRMKCTRQRCQLALPNRPSAVALDVCGFGKVTVTPASTHSLICSPSK